MGNNNELFQLLKNSKLSRFRRALCPPQTPAAPPRRPPRLAAWSAHRASGPGPRGPARPRQGCRSLGGGLPPTRYAAARASAAGGLDTRAGAAPPPAASAPRPGGRPRSGPPGEPGRAASTHCPWRRLGGPPGTAARRGLLPVSRLGLCAATDAVWRLRADSAFGHVARVRLA